jgi:hypothetical protein
VRETASEGTDMGILRSSKVADLHTPSIRTRQENGVDSRSAGTGTRNKRDVWTIPTQAFPEAHFATFPQELAETCIKAGCPENVCAECGAGYVRCVEKGASLPVAERRNRDEIGSNSQIGAIVEGSDKYMSGRVMAKHKANNPDVDQGFQLSCTCNGATCNGMVLDPFGGAGTTALAAVHLGREYQLIELNIKYVGIAQQRIANYNPMQATLLPTGEKQLSLWSA